MRDRIISKIDIHIIFVYDMHKYNDKKFSISNKKMN